MKLFLTTMLALFVAFTCVATPASAEVDSTEILIKALVKKGIISETDADAVRDEITEIRSQEAANRSSVPVAAKKPLTIGGWIQELYTDSSQAGVKDGLAVRQARLQISGQPTDKMDFKLHLGFEGYSSGITSVDFAKSKTSTGTFSKATIVDAYINYRMTYASKLTVGQFLIPFSYDSLTSNTRTDFINRALVVDALAPGRDNGSQGRDVGMQYSGTSYAGGDGTNQVDYFLAGFNGSGINAIENNKSKDFAARLVYKNVPAGLQLGSSYYNGSAGTLRTNNDHTGFEAVLDNGPWAIRSEYIWANYSAKKANGWYATLLHRFSPTFEAAARYDDYDPNTSVTDNNITRTSLGVNWNLTKDGLSRIQLNQEWRNDRSQNAKYNLFLVQFQTGY